MLPVPFQHEGSTGISLLIQEIYRFNPAYATKAIDYVVEGIEAYTGITIISRKTELVKRRLVNELGSGIMIYKDERGFLPGNFHEYAEVDIIFTVMKDATSIEQLR